MVDLSFVLTILSIFTLCILSQCRYVPMPTDSEIFYLSGESKLYD